MAACQKTSVQRDGERQREREGERQREGERETEREREKLKKTRERQYKKPCTWRKLQKVR